MNYAAMKLGKQPARHDPRTLKLSRYLATEILPPPPESCDYSDAVPSWPMYANDQIGDCAIAGPAHQIQAWSYESGAPDITPSEQDVLAAYSAVSGWNPADPSSDVGCVMLDVLKYWQHTGIGGQKIGAYAQIDIADHEMTERAIWMFGGLAVGLMLPLAAQDQPWQAPKRHRRHGRWARGSWGGHAVEIVGFDNFGVTCVTWGETKYMGWSFLESYADELWAMLSPNWFDGSKKAPNGFDLDQLQRDLAIAGRRAP